AVGYGVHIADVVSQTHRVGIVHRDISPTNLFITIDGRVKLLDFGIAKLLSRDSTVRGKSNRLTLTGTVHYMSPEQALIRDVDARSDIFSMGVVLYEMLTGRRPFTGSTLSEIIQQITRLTPQPVGKLVPNIPSSIEQVV